MYAFFSFHSLPVLLLLFSHSIVYDSLQPHGLQHTRFPCPSPSPRTCLNSSPLSLWCHPTICPLLSPSPPAFNLSQHQGLFLWVGSSHQVANVLELQLQHQSFQWIFRISLNCSLRKVSYLFLLFFGTLQSNGCIFLFLLCLSFLFSAVCKTSSDW